MKIGLLTIEIYGELKFERAVEHFISSMDPILKSVSDDFESDYKRFAFYAAVIKLTVPLKIFWKGDALYNTLKRNLDYSFYNWEFSLTLVIHEKGD